MTHYKTKQVLRRKSYTRGVPKGYSHKWKYKGEWNETKYAPRRWKFRFKATKSREGSTMGGLPIGSSVMWKINAIQGAKKVSGRSYKTDMIGTKEMIRVKINKGKRRY